jgi:hypothetical protein
VKTRLGEGCAELFSQLPIGSVTDTKMIGIVLVPGGNATGFTFVDFEG